MSEHTGEDGLLPLLRAGRWYASRDTAPVPGGPLLSLAPEIMIRDDAARLRRERADWRPFPAKERPAVLRAAVELFADAALPIEGLGVQDPDDFAAAMRACAGLPPVLVRRWSDMLRDAAEDPPHGEREEAELALVSLPANTFTCLEGVLEAALTSEAVWIRPSRREPLSAARLVAALLGAGWPAERLGYYPTLPSVLPALIRQTSRQIVYGGEQLVRGLADTGPTLDLRGPGRACVILGPEPPEDPRALALRLAGLVAADAGRFCTNVCVIARVGDVGPVARPLAEILDGIALTPPDPRWPMASVPEADARRIMHFIIERLEPGGRVLTRRPLLVRAGGETFLAPTLVQVDDADHPLVGCELPFPFVVAVSTTAAGTGRVAARSRFVHADPPAPSWKERRAERHRPHGNDA